MSRGHYMPPPFTNLQDWFNYAFASTHVKGQLLLKHFVTFEFISYFDETLKLVILSEDWRKNIEIYVRVFMALVLIDEW